MKNIFINKDIREAAISFLKNIDRSNFEGYNLPFTKFVFSRDDLHEMAYDLDFSIKSYSITKLNQNILEYENKINDDIFIKIDDYKEFFILLSKIIKAYNKDVNMDNYNSIYLFESLWLRMGVNDINNINYFLKKQLSFLEENNLFKGKCQEFGSYKNLKLYYSDEINEFWFETNRHIKIILCNPKNEEVFYEKVRYDFPAIHYELTKEKNNKVCYIYGIQNLGVEIKDDSIKEVLKEEKNQLRNNYVSTDFILDLKFFIELLKKYNITYVKVPLLQVFNYKYHEAISNNIINQMNDYTEVEIEKFEEMNKNGELTNAVLDYLHNKKTYYKFAEKEDLISRNKTERLINTFMIMEEKYHNITFLSDPFIEDDTLHIKIR